MSAVSFQVRLRVLRALHEKLLERFFGSVEAYPTTGWQGLDQLRISSGNVAEGVHYAPTPRLLVRWIHRMLPEDLRRWSFVDIGSGRGRVVAEAARVTYEQVVGVDFSPELCAMAEKNVAALSGGTVRAGTVEIRCGDATELTPPEGPTVYFLFNPFGERVLQMFLTHVLAAYDRSPRPIVFIYVNPKWPGPFASAGQLTRARLPALLRLKLAALSPFRVQVYSTVEALPELRS